MRPKCLLAIMGPYPMGCSGGNTHQRFHEVAARTKAADVQVYVIPDLVPTVGHTDAYNAEWGPKHRGIHAMRCHAAEKARREGWDYLFIVENDVVLPPETLDCLMARQKDLIVPRHEFPDFPVIRCQVYQPVYSEHQTGLMETKWCGYPATLYRMAAFRGVDPMFVGGGEGFDYDRWHQAAIQTWMDLDVEAVNLRLAGPHQVLLSVPGAVTNHLKKTAWGEKVLCDGKIFEYRTRDDEDGVEVFHLACHGCKWRIDYKPPPNYRSEALFIGRVLERAVAGKGH